MISGVCSTRHSGRLRPNSPIPYLNVARRLEIELTSNRDDGKWTWRAAGAKQPKGILEGSLLPKGSSVGDVLKVEADASLEGLEITTILKDRAPRSEVETLQLLGSGDQTELVTSQLVGQDRSASSKAKRKFGRDKERRSKRDSKRRTKTGDNKGDGTTTKKSSGKERNKKRNTRERRERVAAPLVPRAPRLQPKSKYRRAALAEMPDIQHELAEEVLKGGIPGVRETVERMNQMAKADGIPKVKTELLVALAEKMLPKLKAAEWRDRAEAAIAGIETLDLRDIRSVVVAADSGARDEETRELAEKLRAGLTTRVENEHRLWLNEIAQQLADGRTVRALNLSSRPPKAGSPLPPDIAERLATSAGASLSSDVAQDRWAVVLEAIAFSPVRSQVTPQGCPNDPNEELLATVRKLASKVPEIAALFGIESPAVNKNTTGKPRLTPPPPPTAPEPSLSND